MKNAHFLTGPGRSYTRFGEAARFREGLYRVGRDTYAWMVPNGSWGETNIGLVECGGQSVLVDTCWDLRFTHEMLRDAADVVRRAPIEYVINTHSDGDHCWGNQLFKDKPILATHACVKQMHHTRPETFTALVRGDALLRHVKVAGLDQFSHYMREMLRPYAFDDVTITDPNQPFSGETTLNVRGTDLVLYEVGPGHTDGDCLVYVPDRRVVFTGDVAFVGVTPVAWAGPIENLVAALRRVLALDVDIIVPGHGPLATRDDIRHLIDYWDFVQNAMFDRHRRGMPARDAVRETMRSATFRESVFASWDSPERMLTSAFTLYRHWGTRESRLPGMLATIDQMRQQAAIALEWPQATPTCMHRR